MTGHDLKSVSGHGISGTSQRGNCCTDNRVAVGEPEGRSRSVATTYTNGRSYSGEIDLDAGWRLRPATYRLKQAMAATFPLSELDQR